MGRRGGVTAQTNGPAFFDAVLFALPSSVPGWFGLSLVLT